MSGASPVPQIVEALGSTRILLKSPTGTLLWDFLITDRGASSRSEMCELLASIPGRGVAESCL